MPEAAVCKKGKQFDIIPPTRAAMLEHCERAVYQAGYIWEQARTPCPAQHKTGIRTLDGGSCSGDLSGQHCQKRWVSARNFSMLLKEGLTEVMFLCKSLSTLQYPLNVSR